VPLYFFDVVEDDRHMVDDEGTELDNQEAARLEAIQAMAELANDRLPGLSRKHAKMIVRDDAERHIFELEFTFAVRGLGRAT